MNWKKILIDCGVAVSDAVHWEKAFAAEVKPAAFSTGFDELDDFLAQILHESGMLKRTVENLNYTKPERIKAVWPSRFPTVESAQPFARNPEGLANKVYSGRMGNVKPGDGWKYRGRGLIMLTGRDNYRRVGNAIGVDLENNPDFLSSPSIALRASIAWWEGAVPDAFMDKVIKVTKAVNGGTVGLAHRTELFAKVKSVLEANT